LHKLADRSITEKGLLQQVKQNFDLLPEVLEGTSSSKAAVRYSCAKVLMDLSDECPERLYLYMDSFIDLLDTKYRILTWNALAIVANLARVDRDKKLDVIFDKYYSFLNDAYMVTVANVVGNSSKIALAKPYLINRIANELLKVENLTVTPHLTEECKRVIAEKTIESFDVFYNQIHNKKRVLSFARKYVGSSRKTLKVKAENFLRKRAR
jgi:hypothetical protein